MEYYNKTILLVEDEKINARLCRKTLEKYRFKVIHAATGEEAVSIMDSTPGIDLILMDIDLGDGIYGTDAAEIILKKHDIPLIFHTSHTDRKIVEKTDRITSYGYIVKNTGETVLIASIKMAFRLFESKKNDQAKAAELQKSEERFRMILDDIPSVAVQGFKPDGTVVYWDRSSEKIYGYKPDEILGHNIIDLLVPFDCRDSICSNIKNITENGILPPFSETVFLNKSGFLVTVMRSYSIIKRTGGEKEIFCIDVDITRRKEAEELIRLKNEELAVINEELCASMEEFEAANEELIQSNNQLLEMEADYLKMIKGKDILLRESQHRFKNNLNTVYGMLFLQGALQNDSVCKCVLENAASRVQSMIMLYDKLDYCINESRVNTSRYFPSLIEEIVSVNSFSLQVKTHVEIADFELDTASVKIISILINEMITNSIKHAFVNRDTGLISVSVFKNNNDVIINYKDDGAGLPEPCMPVQSSGFGMELIRMLVDQRKGVMEVTSVNGVNYSIRFCAE